MLKKIFIVATFAVLMLSLQVVSVAPPIDWSKVKHISSKSELGQYVESQKKREKLLFP